MSILLPPDSGLNLAAFTPTAPQTRSADRARNTPRRARVRFQRRQDRSAWLPHTPVVADGATDWLGRVATWAGFTGGNYQSGTVVCRVAPTAGNDRILEALDGNLNSAFSLSINTLGVSFLALEDTFTIGLDSAQSWLTLFNAGVYSTIHFAFDNSSGSQRCDLWVDGIKKTPDIEASFGLAGPIPSAFASGVRLFANAAGANRFAGDIRFLWARFAQADSSGYVDNIGAFYDGGRDVDLGANGTGPTGLLPAPTVYLLGGRQRADDSDQDGAAGGINDGKNYGTGGDFTVNGAFV